jgi:hypothetical protein
LLQRQHPRLRSRLLLPPCGFGLSQIFRELGDLGFESAQGGKAFGRRRLGELMLQGFNLGYLALQPVHLLGVVLTS